MAVTFTISGDDAIIRALSEIRIDALRDDMEAALREMAADAADYDKAPELPNQRYVRTGDLGRGWTQGVPMFQDSAGVLIGEIENSVAYAPDVQGEDQKEIFVERWRTAEMIMDAWEDEIARRVDAATERMLEYL